MQLVQGADMTPTATATAAIEEAHKSVGDLLKRWAELKDKDVKALNEKLREAKLPEIKTDG
jgi:hypothetical protein